MSLLSFLRVVEEIQQPRRKNHVPPRTRRLAVEALEGRAVLTLLGSLTPPIQILTETIIAPVIESLPLVPSPPPQATPLPEGGSGSGTGEPEPVDPGSEPPSDNGGSGSGTGEPEPTDPSSEPPSDNGGSGSGTGEPEPTDPSSEPPPDNGGSGSGTGEPTEPLPDSGGSGSGSGGSSPVISSLDSERANLWVWFSGTVTDSDGPVEGLTVYFSFSDTSLVAFTTTVGADGSFRTADLMIDLGISIYAYTIDAQGNQSLITSCIA